MKLYTFKRGIHPADEKAYSSAKAIETVQPITGHEMVYPIHQHLGAPCLPTVEIGEKVLKGQKIADTEAYVSAPVHTSVSGIVKKFKKTILPNGMAGDAIVIENDGNDEEHASLNKTNDYSKLTKEEILKLIREAGIVGMGGAGFPTHVKLNPPPDKKVDTILINGSECEPFLTNDHRIMLEQTQRVIDGFKVILSLFDGARGIIGIETNKMDAIEKITEGCKNISNMEVMPLVPKYPQGSEKQLIYACTGREVPSQKLPADIGCVVINVETCLAVERAVVRGRPLMNRKITVSGDLIKNPGNYKVQLGMSYADLVKSIGGLTGTPYKIISGGPMMGVAMYTLETPVIKTSSSVIFMSRQMGELPQETNCIRCGRCVDHCPMALMPLELNQYVLHNDLDLFEKYNGLDCVECGSCSYVCPAKRYLAQSIRATRRSLLASKKK